MSGFAFSFSFSIAGIFAGIAIDKGQRIKILSLAVLLHSLSQVFIGKINSFFIFIFLRFFNGIAMSAIEPAIFSLIGDYFPSNLKSTAIAIIIAGTFLGTSGSSLCI